MNFQSLTSGVSLVQNSDHMACGDKQESGENNACSPKIDVNPRLFSP